MKEPWVKSRFCKEKCNFLSSGIAGLKNSCTFATHLRKTSAADIGSLDEWLSQRSAKPCTAVRIRQEPPESLNALLAQLVEQLTLNQWVQGSNP